MSELYSFTEEDAIRYILKEAALPKTSVLLLPVFLAEISRQFDKLYLQEIERILRGFDECDKYLVAKPFAGREKLDYASVLPQTKDKDYPYVAVFANAPTHRVFEHALQERLDVTYMENFERLPNTGLMVPRTGGTIALSLNAGLN